MHHHLHWPRNRKRADICSKPHLSYLCELWRFVHVVCHRHGPSSSPGSSSDPRRRSSIARRRRGRRERRGRGAAAARREPEPRRRAAEAPSPPPAQRRRRQQEERGQGRSHPPRRSDSWRSRDWMGLLRSRRKWVRENSPSFSIFLSGEKGNLGECVWDLSSTPFFFLPRWLAPFEPLLLLFLFLDLLFSHFLRREST